MMKHLVIKLVGEVRLRNTTHETHVDLSYLVRTRLPWSTLTDGTVRTRRDGFEFMSVHTYLGIIYVVHHVHNDLFHTPALTMNTSVYNKTNDPHHFHRQSEAPKERQRVSIQAHLFSQSLTIQCPALEIDGIKVSPSWTKLIPVVLYQAQKWREIVIFECE
jgi:hypothetical protein